LTGPFFAAADISSPLSRLNIFCSVDYFSSPPGQPPSSFTPIRHFTPIDV
jgi:hypothetical protein